MKKKTKKKIKKKQPNNKLSKLRVGERKNEGGHQKTKILVAGDVHGDTGLIKKLAQKAKKQNVDLVILSGDFTFFHEHPKNIIGPFTKIKKQVLLVHGNHENLETLDFLSQAYSNAKNLHGYSFKKNNVGIFGAGGAIGFNITEKDMFATLKKAHKKVKDSEKKVMVTHMHPQGSKSEFSGFKGSKAVKKAIKEFKPDLHVHCHIHEAEGMKEKIGKTKVMNIGRRGKILEI